MDSPVVIPEIVLSPVAEQAATAYPEEACGILIGRRRSDGVLVVERARAADNVAPPELRTRRFEVDPRTVIETQRTLRGSGSEIVGFYHSHPDGPARPSPTDLPFLRHWPRTVWLIVEVRDGRSRAPRAWWLESREAEPVELAIEISRDG